MVDGFLQLDLASLAAGFYTVIYSVLLFAIFFIASVLHSLPLAVDYTSYGRGLPTRYLRMFEFLITLAWSCRNSAGCVRVGD